jgi:NAD-dependent dihydropyrimidine dehydrogenase PreA subunit
MRLDIFVPFLRKAKAGVIQTPVRRLTRVARKVLPAALFSDLVTGKPGLVRRWLKWAGPTWASAPMRRAVQGICFTLFLLLFFYVCWPYSARPARTWENWVATETLPASGRRQPPAESKSVRLAIAQSSNDLPRVGQTLHLVDAALASADDPVAGYAGEFRVAAAGPKELVLTTAAELPAEGLAPGPWTLREDPPGAWPAHYTAELARKEKLAAELFLTIDPLVSLSTAVASRSWIWSLASAGIILAVCLLVPRGFCGYLCPLGTLIDLFDWSLAKVGGKRLKKLQVPDDGWWVHVKYYVLLTTMVAALCGVLVSGFVAAIPVITRGLLFTLAPLQTGALRGWHLVPPMHAGHWLSIGLFFAVLGLGIFKPRFWCKYVCPSGAVFSLGNLFRVSERKVEDTCIHCNKCVEICPFDAIKADFTTRTTDCTLCQTCGGVRPTHAIKFVDRWNTVQLKQIEDPPTGETPLGRRGFLSAGAGLAAGVIGGVSLAGAASVSGADLDDPNAWRPVRPPGSLPEQQFLQACIRCGECFKACPNDVLHALGFQQGFEGLWTPHVAADWAGCESSCNACGQVCPTGAIRAIPLEEKQVCRIGLAEVNLQTCLPHAGREACQLCVDECHHAGYHAIEFTRVRTEVDAEGNPVEESGFVAPVVLAEKCVGCGLCQTRCYGINVADKGLLAESAIIVRAGNGKEDRLDRGSYLALRAAEAEQRAAEQKAREQESGGSYLPDFLK